MTEQNKQLISELYILKTGLSLISVEAEKLSAADKAYAEKSENCNLIKQSIEQNKHLYEQNKARACEQKKALAEYKAKESGRKNKGWLYLGLSVIMMIVGAKLMSSSLLMGLGLAIPVALLFAILGLNALNPGRYNTPKAPNIRNAVEFDSNGPKQLAEIKRLEESLVTACSECEEAKAKYEQVYAVSYPVARVIYDTLYDQYNDILRVRDWQYLDLVIHYLDSERADTKKEALLLVDKKVQNDEIVNAIKEASAEICGTIRSVGDLIRMNLDQHFNALSQQLATQHRQTMRELGMLGGSMGRVSDRIEDLSKTTSMQNALLSKIGTNSQKLAEDSDYIIRYIKRS